MSTRRSRVSSFLSTWVQQNTHSSNTEGPTSASPSSSPAPEASQQPIQVQPKHPTDSDSALIVAPAPDTPQRDSPTPSSAHTRTTPGSRPSSRPASMVQPFQPPLMEVASDTPPELQPVFTFLNSHSNKLYQEGYFLKLHDLDSRGRPSTDRTWQECFAQLVGTVLSIWDAADLDSAGDDGEVVPTFINLADASIKMIESLPMNERGGQSLANVLSVSTAASNRYLLHFNTLNSLTQWTAGIRLAMYELATLQEAYTGSLIAGKGKMLNNIRTIMDRSRAPYEDWARVRFGAGTPWRRCWFIINPPDEKEFQKAQKALKKRNPYDKMPLLKGNMKFYESKRITKRSKPIATMTHAYSAYAIYPQSKPLIDQSTLVKIEGKITIHASSDSINEGFVFVMPETHPAVSGFEMMLRFLFPVWDTFNLYGRPNRLIADVLDQRGLMFAMPKGRKYGYLDILDVAGLIHTEGSTSWPDHEWRKQLKELTSKRMLSDDDASRNRKTASRTSLPATNGHSLRFDDTASGRDSPVTSLEFGSPRLGGAAASGQNALHHRRSASEATGAGTMRQNGRDTPSRLAQSTNAYGEYSPPGPIQHQQPGAARSSGPPSETASNRTGGSSPDQAISPDLQALAARSPPPGPVGPPPSFGHAAGQMPSVRPNPAPARRREQSDLDEATLTQMVQATQMRNQSNSPAQVDYRGHGDPYASRNANGYQQGGYQQGPNDRSRGNNNQQDYQQRGMSKNRAPPTKLQTIPASPFIEQGSPILARGGQVLSPDYFPQQVGLNPAAATLASSPFSRSGPEGLRNEAQPSVITAGSNHALQNVTSDTPSNPRDHLERSGSAFSINRKPISPPSPERRFEPGENQRLVHDDNPQYAMQNQQQHQQQQVPPYGQMGYPQQQKEVYPSLSPEDEWPKVLPEQGQSGYRLQYAQPGPPLAPMHGQLPVRSPPPLQQLNHGQQQQNVGPSQRWI